jgi:hypothetical protein
MRSRLAFLFVVAACGSNEPPLSSATELACPAPGALPFRLQTKGFRSEGSQMVVESQTRNKDEASDMLGNPGELVANTYFAGDAALGTPSFRGMKARGPANNGLSVTPLANEFVSLWQYDGVDWGQIARVATDTAGGYDLGGAAAAGTPVYAMLEADGSCAEHYDSRYSAGQKIVLTDIDGTLTLNDDEFSKLQLLDASYVPRMKGQADRLLATWADKGYPIVYLTARPHMFRSETRQWLREQGFPDGAVITAESLADQHGYKAAWVARLMRDFGWDVAAAYGNATTDISAYDEGGILKNRTFIIGEHAGSEGTVAIADDDYGSHIDAFVATQPSL